MYTPINIQRNSKASGEACTLTSIFLKNLKFIFMPILLLGLAFPISAQAATTITVTPITWNIIGLDSNNVSVGPNDFPVGARVCNTGGSAASNVVASFVWDSSNIYVANRPGTNTSLSVATLAASACTDFYFEVEVTRNSLAYNTTRQYHIAVTADIGATTGSTPTPRELYVEHLISQSRNHVTDMQLSTDGSSYSSIAAGGTMTLMVGNTYWIKLVGSTATNGYEQIESFINFPNTIFQVLSVVSTYSAGPSPGDKLYGDACTWDNYPSSPTYRSCLSTGKDGGSVTVTYQVKILSVPGAPLLNPDPLGTLIYDFSGSSFHYNSDLGVSARYANVVNASITKSFSPKTIKANENATLTYTITNPGSQALASVNFADTTNWPAGMTVNSTIVTYSGCGGSPSPSTLSVGATSASFSNIGVAANGTCTIAITVTAAPANTYPDTTNDLFINSTVDTGSTGSDSLVVTDMPPPPTSCTTRVNLASWAFLANTTTVTLGPNVSTATVSSSGGTFAWAGTTGNPLGSWSGIGWQGTNTPALTATTAPYFQFNVDASKYGGLNIASDLVLLPNSAWGGGNGYYVFFDAPGTGAYATLTTAHAATKNTPWKTGANGVVSTANSALPGSSGSNFRINFFGASNTTSSAAYLDNVVITGCPYLTPPTLSKAFATTPIAQGGNSTLTFTIANPNAADTLSGVSFTDTLPTGLVVATPNGLTAPTCTTGTLSGTTRTAVAGTTAISMSTGTLSANASGCTFSVNVTGSVAGSYTNVSDSITATESGPNTTSTGHGTSSLTVVAPPVIAKVFGANTLITGATNTTSLTFSISNPNIATTLTGVQFTAADALPAGLVVATPNGLAGSCGGGTITAVAGSSSVNLTGATLTSGATCIFSVDVTATTTGLKINTITVSSTNGGTGNTSTASILAKDLTPAVSLLKKVGTSAGGPWTTYAGVTVGTNVYYQFTVENTGDAELTSVNVTDPTLTGLGVSLAGCAWANMPLYDVQTCVVGPTPAVSGSHTNTATAHGTYSITVYDSATSSATYATASLAIYKTLAEPTFSAAGELLNYSYLVTNIGSASILGPVQVTDNKIQAPNPVISVTCPDVSTAGNFNNYLDSGSLTGTVAVTNGSPDVLGTSTNFTGQLVVGSVLYIKSVLYTVLSISDTTHLTLTTNYAGTTESGLTIPFGESITCTAIYTVTAADVTSMLVTNTAFATMNGVTSNTDSVTVSNNPTLVFLSDFRAYEENGQVIVRWATASERNTLGFNLLRLDPATGEYRAVNSGLLPGILKPHRTGIYTLRDRGASPGKSYTYQLVEVENFGRERSYGPFTVFVGRNAMKNAPELSSDSDYTREEQDRPELHKPLVGDDTPIQSLSAVSKVGDRIKLYVTDNGIYYVAASDISTLLGIPLTEVSSLIDLGQLSLSNQGNQAAYLPDIDNAGLYFYGTKIDSVYTKQNVYWLDKGSGVFMTVRQGVGPQPSSVEESFTDTLHFEKDKVPWETLFNDPEADYWFWNQIFASASYTDPPKSFFFYPSGLALSESTATLQAHLYGASSTGTANEHHVILSLNGQTTEDWWSGVSPYTITATFPLQAGKNTIKVEGKADTGVSSSFVLIDSFDLTYQRLFEADGDSLFFRGDGARPVTVGGFTLPEIMVFNIKNPLRPILNAATSVAEESGTYNVSLNPAYPDTPYLAVAGSGVKAAYAKAVSASTLSATQNEADYIIIAPAKLVPTARNLAGYRQGQGMKTMVVDLENIINEFNYGISSPLAIRNFLSYAHSKWAKSPRYVLLAGDGSMDYKNNLGYGGNLIPSPMASTPYGLFVSDNYFADFNGDHVPEIAIGRLPVTTPAELLAVINKIKTYESTPGNKNVILLADTPDSEAGDFIADSTALAAVFPAGYILNKIYLYDPSKINDARAALFTAINNGAAFFNYVGHAGPNQLSDSGLINHFPDYGMDDLPLFTNAGMLPVMTAMTCLTGNFSDPYNIILAEALLLKADGGVVAAWAPTGLSDDAQAGILNRAFYRAFLSGKKATIGDVVRQALLVYKSKGNSPFMMDIYNILGDPALRIR